MIVVAEVATVSTEVVVVDGALVAATDVAAPAVVDVLAPTVESALPTAVDVAVPALETASTTAATSSTLSTAATTVGVGLAPTLSSDSPEEEEQQPCQGPTGLTQFDPIPMTWFKVWTPDYYPTPIEIQGQYYDRDDPNQRLPLGECDVHSISRQDLPAGSR